MGTNEQIAKLILQQTWEEREAMAEGLDVPSGAFGTWASQLLEAAEHPQPEPAAQEDDGWIEWEGGECPVPEGTEISVRLRDGREGKDDAPQNWFWGCDQRGYDIIAYKVIKPRPQT
jgi:hypothetical protein